MAAFASTAAHAQNGPVPPARVAVLQADARRAAASADLTTLRAAARGRDTHTALLAIRALGHLERPALIPDILPALRSADPEMRAEAANAVGQAARGWKTASSPAASLSLGAVLSALVGRLQIEADAGVRAALCETIARLSYRSSDEAARAERALSEFAVSAHSVIDRLGAAKAFETFVRLHRQLQPPDNRTLEIVRELSKLPLSDQTTPIDPLRDARIRRLALETLITAERVDEDLIASAASDADPQVRRLAMRAAAVTRSSSAVLANGLADSTGMVRYEALRALFATATAKESPARLDDDAPLCQASMAAARDGEMRVALLALDQLAVCGGSAAAVALLEQRANDLSEAGSPRGWHRPGHAIVALAMASPERAADAIKQIIGSTIWQLRAYGARAAFLLRDRETLEKLAADSNDNVVEVALDGLAKTVGHADDAIYVRALSRSGYQIIRAAAQALDDTPNRGEAVPALTAAWSRLAEENRQNSFDTRAAIRATLTRLGAEPPNTKASRAAPASNNLLNAAGLRRLAAPRARVTIRDVGAFDLALFTTEAPATVLTFASLAESGYYNGLTFHRVVPNFIVQGGSPAANEYVGTADHMPDEVGLWPHVRGAVGISTRGRDTGDGQIFIDLVDNPKFDHEYTVFAQVLNGIEIVDRILEGDVIESIEILP